MSSLYTPLFTDTFQRANENPLSDGGNWSAVGANPQLQVVSDLCVAQTAGSTAVAALTGVSLPDDQYLQFTISGDLTTAEEWLVCLRAPATGFFSLAYNFRLFSNDDGTAAAAIRKGSSTLQSTTLTTVNSGDTFLFQVTGQGSNTVVSLFQNGTLVLSHADTTGEFSSGVAEISVTFGSVQNDTAISEFIAGSVAALSEAPNSAMLLGAGT